MSLRVVLDTNVALDLIVFGDFATQTVAEAVRSGKMTWVSSPKCRSEFRRVIDYPVIARFLQKKGPERPQIDALMAHFDSLSTPDPDPVDATLEPFRCRDQEDQFLIDLAITAGADLLVSKDRKVLHVAKALKKHRKSLRIVTPLELFSALGD